MTLSRALFSSARPSWETPRDLFTLLDREFAFTLDVCAEASNAKCARYFTRAQDALRKRWRGRCWMNPPYGRQIAQWVAKAYQAAQQGALVVSLLPARTDTAWWQDLVMGAREIRLIRGRLKFVGAKSSAPFPSAIVVFRRARSRFKTPRVRTWNLRRVFRHSQINRLATLQIQL